MASRVLCIFGTRPEAVKMAPVIEQLRNKADHVHLRVCVTAQHRQMLDQVLELFQITPDYDLDVMQAGQDLYSLTARLLEKIRSVLEAEKPDLLLVHGDTTTTMAASLAAYYNRVAVGHVEAGLRSNDKYMPFPEEVNRRVTGVLADLHFAPTEKARQNLLREGIGDEHIHVTGNTVIDALLQVNSMLQEDVALQQSMEKRFSWLNKQRRLVVITGHRRENFGHGFQQICRALIDLATEWSNVDFVYPVHLNPNVQQPVEAIIKTSGLDNIHLLAPLDYSAFVYLMNRCVVVLTDSGGIQEEAPSLGKPVVVMRETTERPEAVEAGTVVLAGSSRSRIVGAVSRLLGDKHVYRRMSRAINPYGDGLAGGRIAEVVVRYLETIKGDV